MWFISYNYQVFFIIVLTSNYDIAICDAISNMNFNSHIRDYSNADTINTTNVKTLQKEELGKYATFSPAGNPIKFKEIPDSALSGSSNGRGFGLYHDQSGYTLNDYDEGPHYTHGHDYHSYDAHPEVPHGYEPHQNHHDHHDHHDHHAPHDHDFHHFSGHHHIHHGPYDKHYKHALAAKSLLWPIAGIALLGAAALVTNPVLLQLGVISGKRKRRDTEEITGPDFLSDTFTKYAEKIKKQTKDYSNVKVIQHNENLRKITTPTKDEKAESFNENFRRRLLKTNIQKHSKLNLGTRKIRSSVKRNVDQVTAYPGTYKSDDDDDKFIPIAIKLRTPYSDDNN